MLMQVWQAAKVYTALRIQDGELDASSQQDLLAPLRKPDVLAQIRAHQGLSTIFKLLMSAAEADISYSLKIGTKLFVPIFSHPNVEIQRYEKAK